MRFGAGVLGRRVADSAHVEILGCEVKTQRLAGESRPRLNHRRTTYLIVMVSTCAPATT